MIKIYIDHKLFNILLLCIIYVCLMGCGIFKQKKGYDHGVMGEKIVNTAHSQIGRKYTFGGKSPRQGFDCSGLIWWVYDENQITVPRITKDQAKYGKGVALKYIRKGDIVVFRTRRGPHGLHTGIYAGKNNFIHSPKAGQKVRTESISNSYWSKNLISVRRYVK